MRPFKTLFAALLLLLLSCPSWADSLTVDASIIVRLTEDDPNTANSVTPAVRQALDCCEGDRITRQRSLLRFDFSSLPGDATITSGSIYIYSANIVSYDTYLYDVTQTGWTSSATWNKYDGTNSWTSAGGDVGYSIGNALHNSPNYQYREYSISTTYWNDWKTNHSKIANVLIRFGTESLPQGYSIEYCFFPATATCSSGTTCAKATINYTTATTPTVTTTTPSSVTAISASGGGNVTSDGGATVTDRGVCWNTSGTPTTSDSHTHDSSGTGSYSSSITGLAGRTTYHVRAYAINSQGTAYGSESDFTTPWGGNVDGALNPSSVYGVVNSNIITVHGQSTK